MGRRLTALCRSIFLKRLSWSSVPGIAARADTGSKVSIRARVSSHAVSFFALLMRLSSQP